MDCTLKLFAAQQVAVKNPARYGSRYCIGETRLATARVTVPWVDARYCTLSGSDGVDAWQALSKIKGFFHLLIQPDLSCAPVSFDGAFRNAQHFGDFFNGQSAKKS